MTQILKLRDVVGQERQQPKILIAWFGAFDGFGTIGDLLSLQSLTNYLHARNYDIDYTSYDNFPNLSGTRVDWRTVDANTYRIFIFVCGPILNDRPYLKELFNKFNKCINIGVGVSLLRKDHINYFNPFDIVFAREGAAQVFDDIAIAAPGYNENTLSDRNRETVTIGISLRGKQGEYGLENCLHELTDGTIKQLAETLLQNRKGELLIIENHLRRSGLVPGEIENLYARCDLMITSRLHGALLSLRHSVPYIAIDQIRNGQKVYGVLGNRKWPFIYKIEETNCEALVPVGNEILSGKYRTTFSECRAEMLEGARNTLENVDGCIRHLFD